jgi:hypothetical protein
MRCGVSDQESDTRQGSGVPLLAGISHDDLSAFERERWASVGRSHDWLQPQLAAEGVRLDAASLDCAPGGTGQQTPRLCARREAAQRWESPALQDGVLEGFRKLAESLLSSGRYPPGCRGEFRKRAELISQPLKEPTAHRLPLAGLDP